MNKKLEFFSSMAGSFIYFNFGFFFFLFFREGKIVKHRGNKTFYI